MQVDYYRYRIMSETRFHLLGHLFNEYLVDMFSQADDECLQYIRHKQHRFRKKIMRIMKQSMMRLICIQKISIYLHHTLFRIDGLTKNYGCSCGSK